MSTKPMTDPFHIHPRSKRIAKTPYKPLFRPVTPVETGTSTARAAETYRGHPDYVPKKLPHRYSPVTNASRYGKARGTKPRAARIAINVQWMYLAWLERNAERLKRMNPEWFA